MTIGASSKIARAHCSPVRSRTGPVSTRKASSQSLESVRAERSRGRWHCDLAHPARRLRVRVVRINEIHEPGLRINHLITCAPV